MCTEATVPQNTRSKCLYLRWNAFEGAPLQSLLSRSLTLQSGTSGRKQIENELWPLI